MAENEGLHNCIQETSIALIQEAVPRLEGKIDKLIEHIVGNGKVGLTTRIALLEQSDKRKWWWLGGISLFIVGGAVKFIFL